MKIGKAFKRAFGGVGKAVTGLFKPPKQQISTFTPPEVSYATNLYRSLVEPSLSQFTSDMKDVVSSYRSVVLPTLNLYTQSIQQAADRLDSIDRSLANIPAINTGDIQDMYTGMISGLNLPALTADTNIDTTAYQNRLLNLQSQASSALPSVDLTDVYNRLTSYADRTIADLDLYNMPDALNRAMLKQQEALSVMGMGNTPALQRAMADAVNQVMPQWISQRQQAYNLASNITQGVGQMKLSEAELKTDKALQNLGLQAQILGQAAELDFKSQATSKDNLLNLLKLQSDRELQAKGLQAQLLNNLADLNFRTKATNINNYLDALKMRAGLATTIPSLYSALPDVYQRAYTGLAQLQSLPLTLTTDLITSIGRLQSIPVVTNKAPGLGYSFMQGIGQGLGQAAAAKFGGML